MDGININGYTTIKTYLMPPSVNLKIVNIVNFMDFTTKL